MCYVYIPARLLASVIIRVYVLFSIILMYCILNFALSYVRCTCNTHNNYVVTVKHGVIYYNIILVYCLLSIKRNE